MDIDAVIAEAVTPAVAAQPQADATTTPPEAPEADTPLPEAMEKSAEEMFPKKAVNAISRRDKKIGKQAAEIQQLREENERLKQTATPTPKKEDGPPKEEDFEGKSYGEYLRAVARYEATQIHKETQTKDTESKELTEAQKWERERAEAIDKSAEAAKAAFPDFDDVLEEHLDANGVIPLSPHVRKALLEAENGAYALYALAREGLLEEINDMSPLKAAMTIARMEDKGLSLSKKKAETPTTQAPAPMTPAKGAASAAKPLHQMSPEELLKWQRS